MIWAGSWSPDSKVGEVKNYWPVIRYVRSWPNNHRGVQNFGVCLFWLSLKPTSQLSTNTITLYFCFVATVEQYITSHCIALHCINFVCKVTNTGCICQIHLSFRTIGSCISCTTICLILEFHCAINAVNVGGTQPRLR